MRQKDFLWNFRDLQNGFSENSLSVTYAVTNDIFQSRSQPTFPTRKNDVNGYTVTYTDAFKSKTDNNGNFFKDAFENALNTWCFTTGLNYTIDESLYTNNPPQNNPPWDILVDLQFDPQSFNNPASTLTPKYDTNCAVSINNGSSNHPEVFESDFLKSSTITFWDDTFNGLWDAGAISPTSHNVEKISLHELGHSHGILHTNHEQELMYFSPTGTQITSEAVESSNYLQNHGEQHNCQNGSYSRQTNCTNSTDNLSNPSSDIVITQVDNSSFYILNVENMELSNISLYSINGILIRKYNQTSETRKTYLLPSNIESGSYILTYESVLGKDAKVFNIITN